MAIKQDILPTPLIHLLFPLCSPGFCSFLIFCFMKKKCYLEKQEYWSMFDDCKCLDKTGFGKKLWLWSVLPVHPGIPRFCCYSSGTSCQKCLISIYSFSPWPCCFLLVQGLEQQWLAPCSLPQAGVKWIPSPSLFKTSLFLQIIPHLFIVFLICFSESFLVL